MPAANTMAGASGAAPSVTEAGPPERMMPRGAKARMRSGSAENGQISQ